jgi:transposase
MARPLVTDAQWAEIEPLLPSPKPRPRAGRRPIPNRVALIGILFVLRSGIPVCGLLAAPAARIGSTLS